MLLDAAYQLDNGKLSWTCFTLLITFRASFLLLMSSFLTLNTCILLTHFMPLVSLKNVFRGYRKRPVAWNGLGCLISMLKTTKWNPQFTFQVVVASFMQTISAYSAGTKSTSVYFSIYPERTKRLDEVKAIQKIFCVLF